MLTNDSWKFSSRPCLNSHINQNLKAVKSAICQLWGTWATVIRRTWLRGTVWDQSVCVCVELACCSLAVRCMCTCLGVPLCVFCGCQRGERGPNVLSRQPSAQELTCVPINTAVTPLTRSPAGPRSPAEHTEIQHRDTLGREGTGGGSKETGRERLTTWDQNHNLYSHPVKAARHFSNVNTETQRQPLITSVIIWYITITTSTHEVLRAVNGTA